MTFLKKIEKPNFFFLKKSRHFYETAPSITTQNPQKKHLKNHPKPLHCTAQKFLYGTKVPVYSNLIRCIQIFMYIQISKFLCPHFALLLFIFNSRPIYSAASNVFLICSTTFIVPLICSTAFKVPLNCSTLNFHSLCTKFDL